MIFFFFLDWVCGLFYVWTLQKIKLQIQNNKIVMVQVSANMQTRYVFGKNMCVLPPS